MELNQAKCHEHNWEFKFYNADDRDSIIKTHFSPDIYKAYTSINPEYGPAQADFFRYCLMYLYGGMYIDIKSEFNPNILNVLNTDKYDIFLSHWSEKYKNVGENYVKYGSQGEICNWILISKPK
jgi:mannosyltransferase OCH1-like enzyme